jgi:tRNA modification GTPase
VAITSPVAGTTRDAIEVALDFDGYPVTLVDTAGLRQTTDAIESIGIDRAQFSAKTADLRIAIIAPDAPLNDSARALLLDTDLTVWNKSDIESRGDGTLNISTVTGDGLLELIAAIKDRLDLADPSGASALLRDRHDAALREALTAIDRYEVLASDPASDVGDTPEIAAEHLRVARASLGTITGDVGVERLLDVIFSEFCLGK